MGEALLVSQITDALVKLTVLAMAAFLFSMALTPVYTYIAYRYRFWKRPRETDIEGNPLAVFSKLHKEKHERHIPTMAGVIMVVVVALITIIANLDRRQTWLPLVALIGGALIGLIDDIINIRGKGKGVGGLRSSLKFAMISAVALVAAWYFFTKLEYSSLLHSVCRPMGNWLGNYTDILRLRLLRQAMQVNISDGLDGLAGGLLAQAYAFFGIIATSAGQTTVLRDSVSQYWGHSSATCGSIFTLHVSSWATLAASRLERPWVWLRC